MDQELERFKTEIDLREYAAQQGYELDRKKSWNGSAVMRHSNNDKIIIKRESDGHYVYFSVRDDRDNGTILDFVQHRRGTSLGEARKELREFIGRPVSLFVPYPPLVPVAKDRIRLERAYERMEAAIEHPYLEQERGIPRETLASRRFAGRIRKDHRGNAVFPHFDAEGLCGYEIKNSGVTLFSKGGSKGLWTSHAEQGDNRLVVCESAIDALSFATLYADKQARYASISGRPTPLQRELLRAETAVLPHSSTVVAAMDDDAAGRELADIVLEAARAAARPDLRFETAFPAGAKDWNDVLRTRRRSLLPRHATEPSVV